MSRLLAAAATLLLALCLAGGGARPAEAAFPGRNGLIAFTSDRDRIALGELVSIGADGRGRRALTRNWLVESAPRHAPRGSLVAFVREDGLWVMDARRGGPRRLVTATRLGAALAWSPDARRLAYTLPPRRGEQPYDVWVVGSDGTGRRRLGTCWGQLSEGGPCLSWSADGRSVVVGQGPRLVKLSVDGRATTLLRTRAAYSPVVAPVGGRILFQAYGGVALLERGRMRMVLRGECRDPAWAPARRRFVCRGPEGLMIVPLSGSARRIAALEEGLPPVWSPDGRRIALAAFGEIWTVSPDGTDQRPVVREGLSNVASVTWSSDGTRLVYLLYAESRGRGLWVVRPDGSGARRIVDRVTDDVAPAWSPDGTRVAFACGRRLCLARPDGSGRTQLRLPVRVARGGLTWSPDGTHLAFAGLRGNGMRIYVVRRDGRGLRRLTRGTVDEQGPAWSPDGTRIAFAAEVEPWNWNLHVAEADGSGIENISHQAVWDERYGYFDVGASWSPDGAWLAFYSSRGEGCDESCPAVDVYATDPSGRALRQLTSTMEAWAPTWSPDGRRVLFAYGNGLSSVVFGRQRMRPVTAPHPRFTDALSDWQPLCTRYGGRGADRLRGTAARDVLCGVAGRDVLDGGAGGDVLLGGDGDDRLAGGPGRDRLFGGFGNDVTEAGDGERDVIRCGPGFDTVLADAHDVVAGDCEVVERR